MTGGSGGGNSVPTRWYDVYSIAEQGQMLTEAELGRYRYRYALMDSEAFLSACTSPILTDLVLAEERLGTIGFNANARSFVFKRNLARETFADYVGLHEHIEHLCSRQYGVSAHLFARKIEINEVLKRERRFVEQYAEWLISLARASKQFACGLVGTARASYFLQLLRDPRYSARELLECAEEALNRLLHC